MDGAVEERQGPRREGPEYETVEELLVGVESVANRAADIIHATARAVGGDRLELYHDEDVQTALAAALEHVAAELSALADRALRARTGGA